MSILDPIPDTGQLQFSQSVLAEIDNPSASSIRTRGAFRTNGPQAVFMVQDEILGTVARRASCVWDWARLPSSRLPDWDAPKSGVVASKVEALMLASGEEIAKTQIPESDEHRQVLL